MGAHEGDVLNLLPRRLYHRITTVASHPYTVGAGGDVDGVVVRIARVEIRREGLDEVPVCPRQDIAGRRRLIRRGREAQYTRPRLSAVRRPVYGTRDVNSRSQGSSYVCRTHVDDVRVGWMHSVIYHPPKVGGTTRRWSYSLPAGRGCGT